jgi:hypothetical protein
MRLAPLVALGTCLLTPACVIVFGDDEADFGGDPDGSLDGADFGETGETGDAGDTGETDTGTDTGDPEGPLVPTLSDEPAVPNALWTLRWAVEGSLTHIDAAPLGLALASSHQCALIDRGTGETEWVLPELSTTLASTLRLAGDELVWGQRKEGSPWQLYHYDAAGEYTGVVQIPSLGRLSLDTTGRVYAEGAEILSGFSAEGASMWSQDLDPSYALAELEGLSAGALVLEVDDQGGSPIDMRLSRLGIDGEVTGTVDFATELALIDELALVGDRVYVAADAGLGLEATLFAVDFDAGLAWSVGFGTDTEIAVEPGPEGGAYLLLAPAGQGATLAFVDPQGTVDELGPASAGELHELLFAVGPSDQVFAGGFTEGVFEISRLQ